MLPPVTREVPLSLACMLRVAGDGHESCGRMLQVTDKILKLAMALQEPQQSGPESATCKMLASLEHMPGSCLLCIPAPSHMPASKGTCPADHAPQAHDGQAPRPVPSKAAQLVLGQVPRACHVADCPPGIHAHGSSVVNGEHAIAAMRLTQWMHLSSGDKVHT